MSNENNESAIEPTQAGQNPTQLEPEDSSTSAIPSEILDKLPPEARNMVEMSLMTMGPMPNPLLKQVNQEHIHKALDNAEKRDSRHAEAHKVEVSDRKHGRVTTWIGIAIVVIIVGFLWMNVSQDRLSSLQDVIKTLLAMGGVGFGGYGYAMKKIAEKTD